MSLVAALGEAARVEGFALGGALVIPAEDADSVRRSWDVLPTDVAVVVLTEAAAVALDESTGREDILRVVIRS